MASTLRVEDGIPKGATPPDLEEEPQLTAPGIDPDMLKDMAKRLSQIDGRSNTTEAAGRRSALGANFL